MRNLTLRTNHRTHNPVTVTFGMRDFAAQIAYGWGHCHALMAALSERTGWQPVAAFDLPEPKTTPDPIPVHCAVQRPDGLIVDIDGVWTPDESWTDYGLVNWQPVELRDWVTWGYRSIRVAREHAESVVDAVLANATDKAALKVLS